MTTGDGLPVADLWRELGPGDAVEAYCNGRMVHRGPIVDAIPQCGLLWILDTVTGARCLVEVSELAVVRIPPPAVQPGIRRFLPKGRRRAGGTPPSSWRDASPRR